MCHNISKTEWSASLFYNICGGNYGDPDFKIVAEELYLQDIGSEVYTEYGYEADYFKLMMENPALAEMKRGHIHSHNKMSVFFSSTDKEEILDNSEFYNYYLSLIVNNINEMTAKIAFRVKGNGTINRKLTFNDINGNPKTIDDVENFSDTSVFIYNCNIIKPYVPEETLVNQYNSIIAKKLEEEKEKERLKNLKTFSSEKNHFNFHTESSHNNTEWDYNNKGFKKPLQINLDINQGNDVQEDLLYKFISSLFCDKNIKLLSVVFTEIDSIHPTGKEKNSFLEKRFKLLYQCYFEVYSTDPNYENLDEILIDCMNFLEDNYSISFPDLTRRINKLFQKTVAIYG